MKHLAFLPVVLIGLSLVAQEKQNSVVPNENLITVNIPAIPKELSASVRKYTESRSAVLASVKPDGKALIIGTRFGNTLQLHQVTQPLGMREQLTFFDEPVANATYEPTKGEYLIYSRDNGGNEFGQLYRLDLKTGESTLLTDGKRTQNGGVAWKKDGSGFYYSSTERNGGDRDLWYMDLSGTPKRRIVRELSGGGWGISDVSDDGNRLLVSEYVSANESHIWLLDVNSGSFTAVTDRKKSKGVAQNSARFSADAQTIWLITDRDNEFQRLAKMDLKSGKFQYLITSIPWNVEDLELSHDRSRLAFVANVAGSNELYLLGASDTAFTKVDLPLGMMDQLQFSADGSRLFFTFSTARTAGDVYQLNLADRKVERWTKSELGGIQETDISLPQRIGWQSFDNQEISGFYYPAAAKFTGKRPVLISIHGGPEGQSTADFLASWNYYTNELGVAIIEPNVRGSSGYGKTFLAADNGFKREDSVKDIGALLDWIATQPDLDKDRIMIMGGSYGGYMTLATAFHYADKIRCSVDIVGISNFNTFLKNTETYRRDLRRVEYGDERDAKMSAFFEKIAPLNNTDKITKPMFIIQGTNDPRVPVTEAVQMRDKLQSAGKTVWYLEATDEGHGFRKKANQDFQRLAVIQFMKQYLLH